MDRGSFCRRCLVTKELLIFSLSSPTTGTTSTTWYGHNYPISCTFQSNANLILSLCVKLVSLLMFKEGLFKSNRPTNSFNCCVVFLLSLLLLHPPALDPQKYIQPLFLLSCTLGYHRPTYKDASIRNGEQGTRINLEGGGGDQIISIPCTHPLRPSAA